MARGEEPKASIEPDFIRSHRMIDKPVGERWLYIFIWSYCVQCRRARIKRPTNSFLATQAGLKGHPIEEYLQDLASADPPLIILDKEWIEPIGIREKNSRMKWKDGSEPKEEKPKEAKPAKKKKANGKKKKGDPRIKRIIDRYHEQYQVVLKEVPTIEDGRDAAIVKTLLRHNSEEEINRIMDIFLKMDRKNKFIRERGHIIPVFKMLFHGIKESKKPGQAEIDFEAHAKRIGE